MSGPLPNSTPKCRRPRLHYWTIRIVKTLVVSLVIAWSIKLTAAEVFVVKGGCVAPEIPDRGRVLVWKLSKEYEVGEIVVFRRDGANFVGRVVAVDRNARTLTLARNHEPEQVVSLDDVIGRGVANTR